MGTIKQNVFVVVQKAQKSLANGKRYHEIIHAQHRLLESVVNVLSGKRKKSAQWVFCCTITGMERESNDFCSEVEPKEK